MHIVYWLWSLCLPGQPREATCVFVFCFDLSVPSLALPLPLSFLCNTRPGWSSPWAPTFGTLLPLITHLCFIIISGMRLKAAAQNLSSLEYWVTALDRFVCLIIFPVVITTFPVYRLPDPSCNPAVLEDWARVPGCVSNERRGGLELCVRARTEREECFWPSDCGAPVFLFVFFPRQPVYPWSSFLISSLCNLSHLVFNKVKICERDP